LTLGLDAELNSASNRCIFKGCHREKRTFSPQILDPGPLRPVILADSRLLTWVTFLDTWIIRRIKFCIEWYYFQADHRAKKGRGLPQTLGAGHLRLVFFADIRP
jgi:hypothetical protein